MKQVAYLIADAIDKAKKNRLAFSKRMQQSAKEKATPETANFPPQVSLNLNLKKPLPTAAFQEKIEDVAHLLDDEQSILATPTNTLTIHFGDIF